MSTLLVRDQMGYALSLPGIPKRIVSLVPSQTEFLCDLGLEEQIVGITKFCVHPESCYRSKVRVGGTKNPDIEAIRLLNPDIIIANKEENEEEHVLRLKSQFPVWISDVKTIGDAISMMQDLGDLFGKKEKAEEIAVKIRHNFSRMAQPSKKRKALYFIWRKPYMTVNRNTFIHEMMETCGFENIFAEDAARYPKVTGQELLRRKPEVILLSSEPYPFREKHFDELQEIYPDARIFLVDGEMFSWYGSRMVRSAAYFNKLIRKVDGQKPERAS